MCTGEFSVSLLGYCAVCPGVDLSELCLCKVVVWDCVSVLFGHAVCECDGVSVCLCSCAVLCNFLVCIDEMMYVPVVVLV